MENMGITELGVAALVLLALMAALPRFVNAIRGSTSNAKIDAIDIQRIIEVSLAPIGDLSSVVREMHTKVDALHTMHSKTDENGIPVWYLPTSFKKDVSEMAGSLEKLAVSEMQIAEALKLLSENNTKTVSTLKRINDKMQNNGAARP